MIAINCAAIPDNLLESELVWLREGCIYRGSQSKHQEKLNMLNGGTLFLDEIGDLPLESTS